MCTKLAALYLRSDRKNAEAHAEAWALRAMQGAPNEDALGQLREIAWRRNDAENAFAWGALAASVAVNPIGARGRLQSLQKQASVCWPIPVPTAPRDVHVLAVQTSARPKPYLEQTLGALEHAGLASWRGPRVIVADGYTPDVDGGWTIDASTRSEGQARTFFRAMSRALALGASRMTLFEDDVLLAKNALVFIDAAVMNTALVSWYECGICPFRSAPRPMYAVVSVQRFARNVALTIPASTMQTVLASDVVKRWSALHGGDEVFKHVLPDAMAAIFYPNLVQHAGATSNVGNDGHGARESFAFAGEDFDARTLL